MFSGKMPDITPAQVIAAIQWVATQAITMGLADQETTKVLVSTASTAVTGLWFIADAWIKHSRNKARAAAIAAGHPDPAA
jgi:hypothetical protein